MDNVVSNQNKFNVYVFLSTFARNLIEVFIPLILFKFGYSLKETLFYYLHISNNNKINLEYSDKVKILGKLTK